MIQALTLLQETTLREIRYKSRILDASNNFGSNSDNIGSKTILVYCNDETEKDWMCLSIHTIWPLIVVVLCCLDDHLYEIFEISVHSSCNLLELIPCDIFNTFDNDFLRMLMKPVTRQRHLITFTRQFPKFSGSNKCQQWHWIIYSITWACTFHKDPNLTFANNPLVCDAMNVDLNLWQL